MQPTIAIFGTLAYDYKMKFDGSFQENILPNKLNKINIGFATDKLEKCYGGAAGNIAINIKKIGGCPLIIARLGSDGTEYLNYLKNKNIITDYIEIEKKQNSACAFITTDKTDNQLSAFYRGPTTAMTKKFLPALKGIKLAIVAPATPQIMLGYLYACQRKKIVTVFDPGQHIFDFNKQDLEQTTKFANFIIANDYEISIITDKLGLTKRELTKNSTLIITHGEKGSTILTPEESEFQIKACKPKKMVDPTGAGDAYRAGFFVGFANGLSLEQCGNMGSIAASFSLESDKSQGTDYDLKVFKKRYRIFTVQPFPLDKNTL